MGGRSGLGGKGDREDVPREADELRGGDGERPEVQAGGVGNAVRMGNTRGWRSNCHTADR